MIILKGLGVSEGIAFGKLLVNELSEEKIEKHEITDIDAEINRYKKAENSTLEYKRMLYKKTCETLGEEEALIFKSHEMMIQDNDYRNSIISIITEEKSNAEYAVQKTSEKFSNFFSEMPDPYMKERAMDIIDISKCILSSLMGNDIQKDAYSLNGDIILSAQDFTPSEISSADKNKIKGFLCSEGSTYSHTSILLRVMKIPGIVCLKEQLDKNYNGKNIIIDGSSGEVYIDPDDSTVEFFKNKQSERNKNNELLKNLIGKENITLDGQKIKLYANMNNPSEIDDILENDSEGIGLLRSEFIYLGRENPPSEEEQFQIYRNILERMSGKKVIIRTLDIGSDKRVDYLGLPFEHNPAMGYRGIRLCLDQPEIFKTQLRAIYRASVYGNVSLMFPMITSVSEIKEIKKYIDVVKKELSQENIKFSDNIEIGIMIETPSAVVISDILAKEVDFFSIGTNDLTQYTLAVDRQNSKVNTIFDTHHKSILRMIKIVVDNAHKNNIWAGICGESAADESLIETYLSIGLDELSMSAPCVLKVRKKILETDVSKIKNNILKNL